MPSQLALRIICTVGEKNALFHWFLGPDVVR